MKGLTGVIHPCNDSYMNTNQSPKVTRVLNGWYTIGGFATGVEIIRDAPGAFWSVRKNETVISLAPTFDDAKALAFSLCAA